MCVAAVCGEGESEALGARVDAFAECVLKQRADEVDAAITRKTLDKVSSEAVLVV